MVFPVLTVLTGVQRSRLPSLSERDLDSAPVTHVKFGTGVVLRFKSY